MPTPIPPTPVPAGFPGSPVTSNAAWTPIIQQVGGVDMALVPVGCFQMGSNQSPDELPVHEQCFDTPFWIDVYEVTNGQYGSEGAFAGASRPRETLTWRDALTFCQARGGRLPTEAEWEYAARGPDNLVYPWGNSFVAANTVYYGNSGDRTADVGSRPGGVSWVGAYDMSGNVYEYTSSIYLPYPYDPTDGRENLADTTSRRVLRGGSFGNAELGVYASRRYPVIPASTGNVDGFRCARDLQPGDLP
jgi:formylglycine-generating enzyme required for sulfatase activity